MQSLARLKHATAASLSVVIAFLFPMYFGISDVSSAAITVMVIAANDTLSSSLSKGIYSIPSHVKLRVGMSASIVIQK